jgi:HD-GYP domain-containing protein (c-di-GMP phosphodiesterase class II)
VTLTEKVQNTMTMPELKVRKNRSGAAHKPVLPSVQDFASRPKFNKSFSPSSYLRFTLLKEQSRRYREKLGLISQVGSVLAGCTALAEIYERLEQSVMRAFPQADALYIYQVDPIHKGVRLVNAVEKTIARPSQVVAAVTPRFSPDGLQSEVVRTSQPLMINDLQRYAALQGCIFPEMNGPMPAQSILLAPMLARKETLGLLELIGEARYRFSTSDCELLTSIGSTAAMAIQNQYLRDEVEQTNRALVKTYESTIESWRRALELRDHKTEGHAARVAEMTVRLGAWLGVERRELVFLRFGAVLHDIGKIGIPDAVLLKPGPLEDDERGIMRKHPEFAFEMLSALPNFAPVLEIPYYHHERWDGQGYPHGLEGEQIPFSARIFSVVDVWDALLSDRPYRNAWREEEAITYIQEESGKQFDPHVVEAFLALVVTRKYQN